MNETEYPKSLGEPWIQTFTGKKFYPFDPQPDQICIEDIAHALSLKCRFSGHLKYHYSVAEHSLNVAELVPRELKIHALLHDAAEAYLPDMPRPIKHDPRMKFYREMEDKIQAAICRRFGLPHETPKEIKEADTVMLVTEAEQLLPGDCEWIKDFDAEPLGKIIGVGDPHVIEYSFLTTIRGLSEYEPRITLMGSDG